MNLNDYLYDSKGNAIAVKLNNELHILSGLWIARYLPEKNIFIDINGKYIGEIKYKNRFVKNINSNYKNSYFGKQTVREKQLGLDIKIANCGQYILESGFVDIEIDDIVLCED